jgi:integrase
VNSPEKNSLPGIFKVSPKLMGMLNALPRKSERVFHKANPDSMYLCLSRVRRRLTMKLQNPRMKRITFHTLRHWKATMEYHKTKDIVHVKNLLRHRKIENTMIYVNLEAALFQDRNDEFHVKMAETPEDLKALLEVGFEYVCEKDGMVFLRKRK